MEALRNCNGVTHSDLDKPVDVADTIEVLLKYLKSSDKRNEMKALKEVNEHGASSTGIEPSINRQR